MAPVHFSKKSLFSLLSVILAGSLTACSARPPGSSSAVSAARDYALAEAAYPKSAPYPDEGAYTNAATGEIKESFYDAYNAWNEERRERFEQAASYEGKLTGFLQKSIPQFLSGQEAENRIYSPLNVYLALGMLAELTDGNSRRQILDLLGADSIRELRSLAAALWNANYCNDGATTSILASSLWLSQDVKFVPSTLEQLADTYYASSYQGQMGSEELNKALEAWLNEQTGGLLEEQASGIELDADTVLALAATIYFRAKWGSEFSEGNTSQEIFHGPEQDIPCDFMYQSGSQEYYWGDKFSATAKYLENGGAMWFLLPNEGVSVDKLLEDEETMRFLTEKENWENQMYLTVNLSVPKFDAASDLDLIADLKALGITDVFDSAVSDFSPAAKDAEGLFLSQAKHAARVAIDEKGCIAAAYTVMAVCGAGAPPHEEIDFVVNRPFLFAITGSDGLPLFIGVVNRPK